MKPQNGGASRLMASVDYAASANTVEGYFIKMGGAVRENLVFVRITERFRQRMSEWFCAANLLGFGMSLLHPSAAFNGNPAYAAFQRNISEEHMAVCLAGLGLLWLVGLIINGSRQKVTSTIRAACAMTGGVVYMVMSLGFLSSYVITGVLGAGVSTYALISALAFYSLYWIIIDKRANG
jgi:hypothetical protein